MIHRLFVFVLLGMAVAGGSGLATAAPARYHPTVTGKIAGLRLAGVEPDGDPLYQVALQTKLSASGGVPPVNLIVSAYMENFTPDTTPILPDLLHPRQNAQNLGGFLQGKALITDNAGDVLYIGSFLAEAFLDNTNHAVMKLDGTGAASGTTGALQGAFTLRKQGGDALIGGAFTGHLALSAAARAQISSHRNATMKPLKQIIGVVTVVPHPMVGRAGNGARSTPLPTGYGTPAPSSHSSSSPKISLLTIGAGIGALVSLLLAGYLFWSDRRARRKRTAGQEEEVSA